MQVRVQYNVVNPALSNRGTNRRRVKKNHVDQLAPGHYDLHRDFDNEELKFKFFIPKVIFLLYIIGQKV